MVYINLNNRDKLCVFPGEYISSPLNLDELQKPHEGETRALINIVERPDVFTIEVAAAGSKSGDFWVSTNGNMLTISGLHKQTGRGKKLYHQNEFSYCCLQREIVLPGNTDPHFLSGVYPDGILLVNVPESKEHFKLPVNKIIVY